MSDSVTMASSAFLVSGFSFLDAETGLSHQSRTRETRN
jgi:hypothetical protein